MRLLVGCDVVWNVGRSDGLTDDIGVVVGNLEGLRLTSPKRKKKSLKATKSMEPNPVVGSQPSVPWNPCLQHTSGGDPAVQLVNPSTTSFVNI